MDLFEWLKDIEKVYEDLMNSAKSINLDDIEEFRDQQRMYFEYYFEEKNELVNNVLSKLAIDLDKEKKIFDDQIDEAIKKIAIQFDKEKDNLQELIIEEAGLDF